MTPALGLTVSHPDKADHGYTLFVALRGYSVGEVVWEYVNPFFRDDVLGAITRSVPTLRAGLPRAAGANLYPEEYAWMNHLYAGQ